MSNQPASVSHAANQDWRTGHGSPDSRVFSPSPKKFVAKGHDAQLEKAQYGRLPVTLTLISGSTYVGTIVKRDKFTITLRHDDQSMFSGKDEIFYKHAIEGVLIDSVTDSSTH